MITDIRSGDLHPLGSFEYSAEDVAATITEIDVDGTLREAAQSAFGATRGAFLRRSLATASVAVGGLMLAADAEAAPQMTKSDLGILRFDLVLEYLQSGLYTEAERLGELTPKTLAWARVVGAHERAHVRAIKGLLGRKSVPSPGFNYGDVTAKENPFIKTAVAFEDLTAALLKWQAVRLDSRSILAAVATLHSVETRHAAWIRHLIGLKPATRAFDQPASQAKMAQLISSTHFVSTRRANVKARRNPPYTG
jgi:hypothetical protein